MTPGSAWLNESASAVVWLGGTKPAAMSTLTLSVPLWIRPLMLRYFAVIVMRPWDTIRLSSRWMSASRLCVTGVTVLIGGCATMLP